MNKKPPTFEQLNKARIKRNKENPPLNPNNVRKEKCASCPFNEYGKGIGSEFGKEAFNQMRKRLANQALTEANQYCHNDELKGKISIHVCRGIRDIQLKYFHRIGIIESSTDEAWKKALNKS